MNMMGFFLAALLAILIAKTIVYNVPNSKSLF
jgi:hypothetical protein